MWIYAILMKKLISKGLTIMNTDKIYDIWYRLRSNSSLKQKLAILQENKCNETLKLWIYYALNPYLTYGVRALTKASLVNSETEEPVCDSNYLEPHKEFFNLLDNLHNRVFTGNLAKQKIESFFSKVDIKTVELFNSCLNKDIDCGVSITTINKVWPNLLPTFAIAKANPFNNTIPYPCVAELKMNGVRCIAKVKNGKVTLYSSNGRVAEGLSVIEDSILKVIRKYYGLKSKQVNLVLDGELTGSTRRAVSGIFNKALKGTIQATDQDNLLYTVFDLLSGDEWEKRCCKRPQKDRWIDLQRLFKHNLSKHIDLVARWEVDELSKIRVIYNNLIEDGKEGLIIKDPNAPYSFTRNSAFQKIKAECEADLAIIDFLQGTGKRSEYFGSIECTSSDGKIRVLVGSGLTDEDLKYFTEHREESIGKIITVKYNAVIKDKMGNMSLFLPRFVELRSDKLVADSSAKIIAESGTSEI